MGAGLFRLRHGSVFVTGLCPGLGRLQFGGRHRRQEPAEQEHQGQEYAEAAVFSGIKTKESVPSIKEIDVDPEPYLLGLMDVMGELKREILEELRNGNTKKAEFYFGKMRLIYDSTRSLRFAEAIITGFRRKQDVARIQLEGAGSEMLSAKPK